MKIELLQKAIDLLSARGVKELEVSGSTYGIGPLFLIGSVGLDSYAITIHTNDERIEFSHTVKTIINLPPPKLDESDQLLKNVCDAASVIKYKGKPQDLGCLTATLAGVQKYLVEKGIIK